MASGVEWVVMGALMALLVLALLVGAIVLVVILIVKKTSRPTPAPGRVFRATPAAPMPRKVAEGPGRNIR